MWQVKRQTMFRPVQLVSTAAPSPVHTRVDSDSGPGDKSYNILIPLIMDYDQRNDTIRYWIMKRSICISSYISSNVVLNVL